jgi:hypothetical protein
MASRVESAQDIASLACVEALLERLREAGVTWELKRALGRFW